MKKTFALLIVIFALTSFHSKPQITIDKQEAKKAFLLLTDIRTNPAKYYKELNFLKGINISKTRLIWNDTLAKVAEAKAFDMANRNYFDHVNPDGFGINYLISKTGYSLESDWLKHKDDNFFESIAAGSADGEDAIKILLIDENTPSFGHRNHLLGLYEWNASLRDIGIGFAQCDSGCTFPTYVSIIIAKHRW